MEKSISLAETLKGFRTKIQKLVGVKISEKEALDLFKKYGSEDIDVKLDRVLAATKASGENSLEDNALNCSRMTLQKLQDTINQRLFSRFGSPLGDNRVRKAYNLLSDGRRSHLSLEQVRQLMLSKLSLNVPMSIISQLFEIIDPHNTGTVRTMALVAQITSSNDDKLQGSLRLNEKDEPSVQSVEAHSHAYASHDGCVLHLAPPPSIKTAVEKGTWSIEDIEEAIYQQILQRTGKGSTMLQTLMRCFEAQGSLGIRKDQVTFSLRTKFQLPLSDADIDVFIAKYDLSQTGVISLQDLVKGIIQGREKSEPLLQDIHAANQSLADAPDRDESIDTLLSVLKKSIALKANKESRAPHDILHSTSRLRLDQLMMFLAKRLHMDANTIEKATPLLLKHYFKDGLVDVKKMLYDAMAYKGNKLDDLTSTSNLLMTSSVLQNDELPFSLRSTSYTPEQIRDLLVSKLNERTKNTDNPLSALQKLMKNGRNSLLISKVDIENLFGRFDIVVSSTAFDEFFKVHDRGDGFIDLRIFLNCLMPVPKHEDNPLSPKASDDIKKELEFANMFGKLTGRRREVSSINGVQDNRFDRVIPSRPSTTSAISRTTSFPNTFDSSPFPNVTSTNCIVFPVADSQSCVNIKGSFDYSDPIDTTLVLDRVTSPPVEQSLSDSLSSRQEEHNISSDPTSASARVHTVEFDISGDQNQAPRPPQISDQKWASPRRKGFIVSSSKIPKEKGKEGRPISPTFAAATAATISHTSHSNQSNVHKSRRVPSYTASPQRPFTASPSRSKLSRDGFSPRGNRTSTQIYIDPFNPVLLQRYRVSNKYVTTNNETYGLFVKKINQVLNVQKKFNGSSGFVTLR